jgi:sulfur-carrier protein
VKVLFPSALRSYTVQSEIELSAATLNAALNELERCYPGIRFRMIDEQNNIRPHIRFFLNGVQIRDFQQPLCDLDELIIVQALSGG